MMLPNNIQWLSGAGLSYPRPRHAQKSCGGTPPSGMASLPHCYCLCLLMTAATCQTDHPWRRQSRGQTQQSDAMVMFSQCQCLHWGQVASANDPPRRVRLAVWSQCQSSCIQSLSISWSNPRTGNASTKKVFFRHRTTTSQTTVMTECKKTNGGQVLMAS